MSLFDTFRYGNKYRTAPKRKRINWPVFFIGQLFWLIETAHFGWNMTPGSDAEVICDGIVLLITALAFVLPHEAGDKAP